MKTNDTPNLASNETKNLVDKHISAEDTYQFIRLFKRVVEVKAVVFLAVTLFLFAYLYSQIYLRARISSPDYWNLPFYWTLDGVFYITSSILCIVSMVSCLKVLMPNLKNLGSGSTLFNKIAKYRSQQDYVSYLLTKTSSDQDEEKIVRDLANVTNRKNYAFRWGLWSALLCICLIVIMSLI